jgi:hypothetical protein
MSLTESHVKDADLEWIVEITFCHGHSIVWNAPISGKNIAKNTMRTGPYKKAEAAPLRTASLLLQHLVDELERNSRRQATRSSFIPRQPVNF